MLTFTANKKELKRTLGVVALAADDNSDTIWGHALFKISEGGVLNMYATDKDRIGMAACSIKDINDTPVSEFTADPKKMTALLGSSDTEEIRFRYNPEDKTLNVHVSDDRDSYMAFPSLDPEDFLSFDDVLKKASEVKTFNAGVFLAGVRFIDGFLPTDERQPKFSRMYISNGILYGSNGSSKIGAFQSPEFEGLDNIIVRRQMLAPIASMIDRSNMENLVLKESSKFLVAMSSDGKYGFGFRKTPDQAIKFPINTGKLQGDVFTVDRDFLLRKITRLSIAAGKELGLKMALKELDLTISTVMERPSVETIDCKRISGEDEKEFVIDYHLLKPVLKLFQSSEVDVCVSSSSCIIRNEATLEIKEEGKEEPALKKFTATGLVSLARVLA